MVVKKIFYIFFILFCFSAFSQEMMNNNSSSYIKNSNENIIKMNKLLNPNILLTSNEFKKTIDSFYNYDDIKPNFKAYKYGKYKDNDNQKEEVETDKSDELSLTDKQISILRIAIPYIECYGKDNFFKVSAGIYIDEQTILVPTSFLDKRCDEILVIAYDGLADDPKDDRFYKANILSSSEKWGLAFLETSPIKEPIEVLTMQLFEDRSSDKIYLGTHTQEAYFSIKEASVLQYISNYSWTTANRQFNNNVIELKTPISMIIPGTLYVDSNLSFIGLGIIDEKSSKSLAISSNDIASYFEEILASEAEKQEKTPIQPDSSQEYLECRDTTKSGKIDVCYIDFNQNSIVDGLSVDENEDGIDDVLYIDANENEVYEVKVILPGGYYEYDYTLYLLDEDEDQKYDYIGHDYDNDEEIDEYEEIT